MIICLRNCVCNTANRHFIVSFDVKKNLDGLIISYSQHVLHVRT